MSSPCLFRVENSPSNWLHDPSQVIPNLNREQLRTHLYILKLRDKMIAHDDSVGSAKKISISLTPTEPNNPMFFGIGGGNKQIVSLGRDIAEQLMPHFEWMAIRFNDLEREVRLQTQKDLLAQKFADVVLVGPYEEEEVLDVSIEGLADDTESNCLGIP